MHIGKKEFRDSTSISHLQEVRVRHQIFFRYAPFLTEIARGFPKSKGWYVDQAIFKDGTHWLKAVVGKKGRESELRKLPRHKAIVPFWISTQFGDDAEVTQAIQQIISSLTHKERERPALVDDVIGVAPCIELRQEKDGQGSDDDREVGEAINA